MSLDSDKMKQQDAYLNALRLIYSFTVQKWTERIKSESKNLSDIYKITKYQPMDHCSAVVHDQPHKSLWIVFQS